MAQNLASKFQGDVDERFRLESVTSKIINNGIRLDFEGVNTVSIYNVDTVAETDYTRSGTNRFGSLVELGTGKQTFVLSQDKAFTFSIDKGNLNDSMMAQEAGKALARQISEVSVPTTDKYRLTTLQAYGVAQSQSATAALTSSNVYTKLLDAQAALDDLLVPAEDRLVYATPTTANLLKLDANFTKASDKTVEMLRSGIIGDVDGTQIVKVPTSYLPANTGFVVVHRKVLCSPQKLGTYRTLDNQRGIDGWVVEGRRYYDAFIPTNKGKAVRVHMIA